MNSNFDDMVDLDGLTTEEEARLRRVHEMLVAAGPPAELTSALEGPPAQPAVDRPVSNTVVSNTAEGSPVAGNVASLSSRRRRRPAAMALLAAALAAACFGGGYLAAGGSKGDSIDATRVVALHGEQNSLASLRVGSADTDGNWPIEMKVSGLKDLHDTGDYYILMLVRNGKPRSPCGYFRVKNGAANLRFNVPYKITGTTRWVVTEMQPGASFPGHVVMT